MKFLPIVLGFLILSLPVQLGKHFWPEFSFINGIRIDYLSPTLYLLDLIAIFILLAIRIKQPNIFDKKFYQAFILGFLFLVINFSFSQHPISSLFKGLRFFEMGLLFYVLSKINIAKFNYPLWLTAPVIFSSLLAFFQFIKQSSLGGILYYLGERTFTIDTPGIAKAIINGELFLRSYATFSHPNSFAGFQLVGFILTANYWKKRNPVFFFCYLLLFLIGLFLSFSRIAWVTLFFVFCLILIHKIRPALIKFFIVFVFIVSLFCLINNCQILEETNNSWKTRQRLNIVALEVFKKAPVTGVGLNSFLYHTDQFFLSGSVVFIQPVHNFYLLILSETGLWGGLIMAWFIYKIVIRLKKIKRFDYFLVLLIILYTGLFDHYWLTLIQNQFLMILYLGVVFSKNWNKELKFKQ